MSESEHTQSRGEERYTNHYSFISPPGAGDQPVTGGDFPRDGKVFTQALRMSGSQTGAQVEKVAEMVGPDESVNGSEAGSWASRFWATQSASLKKRLTPADPTNSPSSSRASDSPARQMQKVIADLETRIQFLEAQLERAYQKPDLARFSSSELAIMASEAATNILQVAREENDALVSEAKKILETAKTDAQNRLDEAREEAQSLLADAQSKAANLQADVDSKSDELMASTRAQAETILTEAREEAGAMVFKAKTEEGEILKAALKRRDAMFDELELQRRTMISTLDDAAEIQRLFAEGYGHLRQALDESVANLIEPVKRARRQVNYLDNEIAERGEA